MFYSVHIIAYKLCLKSQLIDHSDVLKYVTSYAWNSKLNSLRIRGEATMFVPHHIVSAEQKN